MFAGCLARLLDPSLAESIAGDLAEQRRRRAAQSRVSAALWFYRESLGVAIYALTQRVGAFARGFVTKSSGSGGFGADVRSTLRSLRRSPWYSATVIGVIALGMALATTVFAVVDGVLFKPLPYPNASRVFSLQPAVTGFFSPQPPGASLVDLQNWSAAAPEAGITGFSAGYFMGLGEDTNESPFGVAQVQRNFFDVVGVQPAVGGFVPGDFDQDLFNQDTGVWPAIISYEMWKGHFLGDPAVIGRTVYGDALRKKGYRIVGIMPPEFLFPSRRTVTLITPLVVTGKRVTDPSARTFEEIVARLPAATSTAAFHAQLQAGLKITAAEFPAPSKDAAKVSRPGAFDQVAIVSLATVMSARLRPLFAAILLAVLVLVALAAVNTSGLMAARCLDRARELGLRRALGAGAAGLARLVIVEALVMIGLGCVVGLGLAPSLLRFGLRLMPGDVMLLKVPAIDWRVAAFVGLSALALAVPTTIWPIRRALRTRAGSISGGSQSSERTRSIGRSLVVSIQIGGAALLSVVGALLVGSLLAVYAYASAIQTGGVIDEQVMITNPDGSPSNGPDRNVRVNAVVTALRGVPGAEFVAATSGQILRGNGWTTWFDAPPAITKPKDVMLDVNVQAVSAEFYRVVRPQVVQGRLPSAEELTSEAPVIVITESVARALWRDQSPVGQMLGYRFDPEPFRVVGVVKDVRLWTLDDRVGSIYGPYTRFARTAALSIFVRTSGHPGEALARATETIERTDPLAHVWRSAMLDDLLLDSIRLRRLQSWMFGSFAAAALAIVCVGVLGLTSMAMARRTREVGIRMALGAARPRVVSLLLREQLTAVVMGIAGGGLVAAWAVRFLTASLYDITAYDLRVWGIALATIIGTATIGTLVPSLRASRTDPVKALRVD